MTIIIPEAGGFGGEVGLEEKRQGLGGVVFVYLFLRGMLWGGVVCLFVF